MNAPIGEALRQLRMRHMLTVEFDVKKYVGSFF